MFRSKSMALSDLAVRQAKATGKAYTLPDLDGLSLAVTAAGGRTWHFRYYWEIGRASCRERVYVLV